MAGDGGTTVISNTPESRGLLASARDDTRGGDDIIGRRINIANDRQRFGRGFGRNRMPYFRGVRQKLGITHRFVEGLTEDREAIGGNGAGCNER